MDYQAVLYDPVYRTLGVAAALTIGTDEPIDFTALDKTAGADVGDRGAEVPTIRPAAVLRMRELAARGVTVNQLPNAKFALNGFEWSIVNYKLRPSPNGESDGEVYLILVGKVST